MEEGSATTTHFLLDSFSISIPQKSELVNHSPDYSVLSKWKNLIPSLLIRLLLRFPNSWGWRVSFKNIDLLFAFEKIRKIVKGKILNMNFSIEIPRQKMKNFLISVGFTSRILGRIDSLKLEESLYWKYLRPFSSLFLYLGDEWI